MSRAAVRWDPQFCSTAPPGPPIPSSIKFPFGLAQTTPSLHLSLCAHQFQLVESGRTLVRRADFQTRAPRFVLQCRRFTNRHSRFPGCLERGSETLCLEGHGRIDPSQTLSMPSNPGANSARMHETANPKKEEWTV